MNTIFKCVVGSTVYGTDNEQSDIDYKGVHIAPKRDLYLGIAEEQTAINKDDMSFELNKFANLLSVSNPTCLEMLYTPDTFISECHPLFRELFIDNRKKFLSKACLNTFAGYVRSQIMKATALDKKMNWEQSRIERRDVLDFCYTFYNQGSTKMRNWLEYRGLKQQYCGLINMPNMHDVYGVYYDLGNHILNEETLPTQEFLSEYLGNNEQITDKRQILDIYLKPIGLRGIVDIAKDSNEVRLSSIPKHLKPICNMSWNKSGYNIHCKDYREYRKWLAERNTQRYVDTKTHGQMIDGKNLLHCRRLLDICKEIATEQDIILKRPNAEYLKDIRKGKYDLNEIIEKAREDLDGMKAIYENSSLPDTVDIDFLRDISYQMRSAIY